MSRATSYAAALLCIAASLAVSACAAHVPNPTATATTTSVPDTSDRPLEQVLDPARYLEVLEQHMLNRPSSRVGFRITSEGAFTAALAGALDLPREGGARIDARGTFGPDSVVLVLRSADGRITGGSGARSFDEPEPPALREALVVGMMRMGILHNLARLAGGAPPDRADGTVRTWAEVRDVAWLPHDPSADRRGLSYDLFVAGQPSGEGVLWLDARGRPVARRLTVRFPQGEMRVTEEYEVR